MPPASPSPTGYPLHVSNFNTLSAGQFLINGSSAATQITPDGVLQLTDTGYSESGIAVYDTPFSSANGISFNFTYESQGGVAPNAGDGIAFDLLDGDKLGSSIAAGSVVPGGYGGGLGYSDAGQDGITDGYLGVAFDTYGNFSTADRGPQTPAPGVTDPVPNEVAVRGEGSGTTGYQYMTGANYAPGVDGERNVQVNLTPIDSTHEILTVYVAPGGTTKYYKVIDTVVNQATPSSLYFGFSASSGGAIDTHAITSLDVSLPVKITFSGATVTDLTTQQASPGQLNPGDSFDYTYTVTNGGPNDDGSIVLTDALPANIINTNYVVTDDAGTHNGSGSSIAVNLSAGDTATVVVSGQVSLNATSGNASHVVTVDPGAAYRLNDPNEALGVDLQIGQGGSSVSLVHANGAILGSDAAPSSPFPDAQVVDTFVDPATEAVPVDTLTVSADPAAGFLSAAGGTYDPSTGVLTVTGTPASLTAALQSVTFTPTPYSVPQGTQKVVQITSSVLDADPQNTTGGGNPSATQVSTVTEFATSTAPVVSGGAPDIVSDATEAVNPLASVVVTDPDYATDTATVRIVGGITNGISFTQASSAGWVSHIDGADMVYSLALPSQQNAGAAVTVAVQKLAVSVPDHIYPAGGSVTTPFTVQIVNGAGQASIVDSDASLTVQATFDTPTVSGVSNVTPTTDEASVRPFATAAVKDPDNAAGSVVISVPTNGAGTVSVPGSTVAVNGAMTSYTVVLPQQANIGAALAATLASVVFTPGAHVAAPGSVTADQVSAALTVSSNGQTAKVSTATSVRVTAAHNLPSVTGGGASQTFDNATVAPFAGVAVNEPDFTGGSLSVAIQGGATSGVTFTPASSQGFTSAVVGNDLVYTLEIPIQANPGAAAQTRLGGLVVQPADHALPVGTSASTTLAVSFIDLSKSVSPVDLNPVVTVTASSTPIAVSGVATMVATSDLQPATPFSAAIVSEPDNVPVTASFTVSGDGSAGVVTAPGFTESRVGGVQTYTEQFAGQPNVGALVTKALQGVQFTPQPHAVPAGASRSTAFSLSLSAGVDGSANAATTVVATASKTTPVVVAGPASQPVLDDGTVTPFSAASVVEPDVTGLVAAVVVHGPGSFTPSSSTGFIVSTDASGNKVYTLTYPVGPGVAGRVDQALRGLVFQPADHVAMPGTSTTTGFSVFVTDDKGGVGMDATASVVSQAVADPVVVTTGPALASIPDTTSVAPFARDGVSDPDLDSGTAVVTIAEGLQKGDFTPASTAGWTRTVSGGDITYSKKLPVTANVGQALQDAIGTLVFQPIRNVTGPGVPSVTAISALLSTGSGLTPLVTIKASVSASSGLLPFLHLVAMGSLTETVSVAASVPTGSHGTFSLLAGGSIQPDGLTYLVSGTAAQVNAALHTVTFTPDSSTSLPAGYTAQVIGTNVADTTLVDTGVTSVQLASPNGNNTVVAGTGNDTIYGGAGMSQLVGGGGDNTFIVGTGATTVSSGTGSAVVYGNSGDVTLVNGPKMTTVVGGAGNSTVFGGTGSALFYGTTGTTTFFGGTAGHNVFISGTGANIAVGGGDGDQLVTVGPGMSLVAAGSGNETLSGAGSSGASTIFGGSGHALIAAGSGPSLIIEDSGTDMVFASTGAPTVIYTGTGSETVVAGAGLDTVVAGSGNILTYAGIGSDQYVATRGHAGGSMSIQDFNVAKDQIGLFGYGPSAVDQAKASATLSGGSTTLNLADGTRITLAGITSLDHVNLVGA